MLKPYLNIDFVEKVCYESLCFLCTQSVSVNIHHGGADAKKFYGCHFISSCSLIPCSKTASPNFNEAPLINQYKSNTSVKSLPTKFFEAKTIVNLSLLTNSLLT